MMALVVVLMVTPIKLRKLCLRAYCKGAIICPLNPQTHLKPVPSTGWLGSAKLLQRKVCATEDLMEWPASFRTALEALREGSLNWRQPSSYVAVCMPSSLQPRRCGITGCLHVRILAQVVAPWDPATMPRE